ncbi:MAG: hypothetical protein Q7S33_02030 [Nanoarchaeota archaeon]|nr:hypothetical protein [Nanoarchaeota archaeon]
MKQDKMKEQIEKNIIDKLSRLHITQFNAGKRKEFDSLPYSTSGGSGNHNSWQYYNLETKQLFSIIKSSGVSWHQDMAGETEREHWTQYNIEVYDGETDECEKIFETSEQRKEDVKKLYNSIESKVRSLEIEKEENKRKNAFDKLEQFLKD